MYMVRLVLPGFSKKNPVFEVVKMAAVGRGGGVDKRVPLFYG